MFRFIPHRAFIEPGATVTHLREEDGRAVATLRIEGLLCTACAANVRRHLRSMGGIESAAVDLDSGEAYVVYRTAEASPEALVRTVEGAVVLRPLRRLLARMASPRTAHAGAGR